MGTTGSTLSASLRPMESVSATAKECRKADRRQLAGDPLERREHASIHEQDAILRVVDDELEVFRKEAEVHGVQDRPAAGDGEVQFEVAIVIPGERAHPVSGSDAESFQGIGQARYALAELSIVVSVDPLLAPGHDLLVGVEGRGSPEEVLQRERKIGHRAAHIGLSPCARPGGSPGSQPSLLCAEYTQRLNAVKPSERRVETAA